MSTGGLGQRSSSSSNIVGSACAPPNWQPLPICSTLVLNGRKHSKIAGLLPPCHGQMAKERLCIYLYRLVGSKRVGMYILACLSLLMLISGSSLLSSHFKPIKEQQMDFVSQIPLGGVAQETQTMEKLAQHQSPDKQLVRSTKEQPWAVRVSDPETPMNVLDLRLIQQRDERMNTTHDASSFFPKSNGNVTGRLGPPVPSDLPLPPGHPCQGFTLPPPPADKKRTGPRPCPVCYLPVEKAIKHMPAPEDSCSPILKNLTYVVEPPTVLSFRGVGGTEFGGHVSFEERDKSFQVQESMHVHCGFIKGIKPGVNTGFDLDEDDLLDMEKCQGIVVASAIFGNYDQLQQPKNISEEAVKSICFFMFVDEETERYLKEESARFNIKKIGLWRVVVVHKLPYSDARRNGKIPKLLLHRLFPNVRFSLWIDGKLELVVDPYQVLERFLWRGNNTLAISQHYKRFDVFEEAEANKAAGKYDNTSIDAQVDLYRREGLKPFSGSKFPIISDVPEGCVIIREHTPISNLFTCLWFNEVDRFTSRDQLSFAIVRDKLMARVPWKMSMFLDCERRNFVVQGYHRDVLEQRKALSPPADELDSAKKVSLDSVNEPVLKSVVDRVTTVKQSPRKVSGRHSRDRRGSSSRQRFGMGRISTKSMHS